MSHLPYSNALRHEYEWVISHTSMCHVIYINESSFKKIKSACIRARRVIDVHESSQIHQWGTSYMWISHVTYINASCHIHQRIMSLTSMSHVIFVDGSCHIHECVMSHTSMRDVTCEWVISCPSVSRVIYIWMNHVTFINASCHVYKCNMTCLCM